MFEESTDNPLSLNEILIFSEDRLRSIDVSFFKKFPLADLVTGLSSLEESQMNTLIRVYFGFERTSVDVASVGNLQSALIKTYQNQTKPIPALFCKYIIENGIPDGENTHGFLAPYYAGFYVRHKYYDLYPDQYVQLVFRNKELEHEFIRDAASRFNEGKIIPYNYDDFYGLTEGYNFNLNVLLQGLRRKYRFDPEKFNHRETLIAIHRGFIKLKKNVEDKKLTTINVDNGEPVIFYRSITDYCDRISIEFLKEYLLYGLDQAINNKAQGQYFTEKSLTSLMRAILFSKKNGEEKRSLIILVHRFFADNKAQRTILSKAWINFCQQFMFNHSIGQPAAPTKPRLFSRKYFYQHQNSNQSNLSITKSATPSKTSVAPLSAKTPKGI